MKNFLIILLSLVLSVSMFAFAACSDTPADDDPQTGNEQTGGDDGQDGTQPDGDDENAGDDTTEEPQEPVGEATQSLTYERYEEGYAVTGVGDETVVVIPSEYEGLPVVSIRRQYGTGAFARSAMTSVVIPDSITEIGNNSFYNCTQLTSVQIGSGSALASIGRNAFSGCRSLAEMYIPASVASIGDSAFNNCGSVNFTVADGNAAYRSENRHLIERATNTLLRAGQSSVIPEGVQIVADRAFSRSVSVTELYIPSSVTEIGNYIAANATLSSIHYAGTEDEWNAVQKGSLWDLDNEGVQIVYSDTAEEETDILVVYFSATGSTERVASYIAEATGGDLFELVPVDPYTSDDLRWTDDDSRVVQEHENEELQNSVELVSATPENWESYDTVFIGYPIWWGIAAWPVNGFITANDFTGKTVVPFCTSSSSGLGESGRLLADMAGEGNWLEGHRFRSSASESDVTDWLGDLGIIG